MNLHFLQGDATNPVEVEGPKILVHCVNCLGVMGSGIALTIKKRWPQVFSRYRDLFAVEHSGGTSYLKNSELLGRCQVIKVGPDFSVANLFGQNETGIETIGDVDIIPADYRALRIGLANLKEQIRRFAPKNISIVAPRICCGLAGGDWQTVQKEIEDVFGNMDINIYVYDFKETIIK